MRRIFLVYTENMDYVFENRQEAGRALAAKLADFLGREDVLFYALPRGGVVVGGVVARALSLPLDVIVTRKIGAPQNPEYALGALGESGDLVWNETELRRETPEQLLHAVRDVVRSEAEEAIRRVEVYRDGRALPVMVGKTVIIVDDGLATGLTMRAAVLVAQHQGAEHIVAAVPHGAHDSLETLRRQRVKVVTVEEPESYGAVGQYYRDFEQVEDDDVLDILRMTTFEC